MIESTGLYLPPFKHILTLLGLNDVDLRTEKVSVYAKALLLLLAEVLRYVEVDESWYLERYPDVRAAVLSGDTTSARFHFAAAGYREGRLPRELPFDAAYYFDQYKDLANTFGRSDVAALRHHYETNGFFEGRAGVPEHFLDAERWRVYLEGRY